MTRLELVTGGARSGKSTFAERRAAQLSGRSRQRAVTYVATAVVTDGEMADRIARHRVRRPAEWRTLEAPLDLGAALRGAAPDGVVLVDCLAVWASNRLLALGDPDEVPGESDGGQGTWRSRLADLEPALTEELDAAIDAGRMRGLDLLLVTNEVGLGIVPPTPLGRAYRDLLGRLNQHVAARADAVHLVIAGVAIDLRRIHLALEGDGDDHAP